MKDLSLQGSDDIANWDDLLTQNPDGGNVFQMAELAETKRKNGWMPRYLVISDVAVTILEKAVFAHGKFWYLPKGPGVTTTVQRALRQFELSSANRVATCDAKRTGC